MQFLHTIEGGIVLNNNMFNTVIEELRFIRKNLISRKGPVTRFKTIEPAEITDPIYGAADDYRGKNKIFIRKYYKTILEVACCKLELNEKGTEKEKNREKELQDRRLAILSKLSECSNILKFYGLTEFDGDRYMVLEWAHYGNLKQVYEAYDIPWIRKLHIATDICRAIIFLQSVG